jgi:hypothetical protein
MTRSISGEPFSPAWTVIAIDFSPLTERDALLPRRGGAGRLTRFRAYQNKTCAAENGEPGKADAEWIAEAVGSAYAREMLAKHQAEEVCRRLGGTTI